MRPEIPIVIDAEAGFNAYFKGPLKPRVVLGAQLVSAMTREELRAICAHELGHYNLFHVERCWLAVLGVYFGAFACLFFEPWYIGVWCAATFAIVGLVAVRLMSQYHELEADLFAVRAVGVPLFRQAYLKVLRGPPTPLTKLRLRFLDFLDG